MYSIPNYKFLSKEAITENDFTELNQLLKICQETDSVNVKLELAYKLSHANCKKSDTNQITEFFCYSDGILISYLGICNFGGELNELTGLTHPKWRRQHIFTQLLQMAISELKMHNQTKLLLLSDHNSVSGAAFLASVGGIYSFSEYGMQLLQPVPSPPQQQVCLRKAQTDDQGNINRINHRLFGDPIIADNDQEENTDYHLLDSTYLICHNSNLIGKICIDISDSYAFIYGFGIINEYRGQGLGTKALQEAIGLIQAKGITSIGLDVAAANDRALHIYTSCGFRKQSVMDYYELNI